MSLTVSPIHLMGCVAYISFIVYTHLSGFLEFSLKLPNMVGQISPIHSLRTREKPSSNRWIFSHWAAQTEIVRSGHPPAAKRRNMGSGRELGSHGTLGIPEYGQYMCSLYTFEKNKAGKIAFMLEYIELWGTNDFSQRELFVTKTTMVKVRQHTFMSTTFHK